MAGTPKNILMKKYNEFGFLTDDEVLLLIKKAEEGRELAVELEAGSAVELYYITLGSSFLNMARAMNIA